jgi:hypothetical protein
MISSAINPASRHGHFMYGDRVLEDPPALFGKVDTFPVRAITIRNAFSPAKSRYDPAHQCNHDVDSINNIVQTHRLISFMYGHVE